VGATRAGGCDGVFFGGDGGVGLAVGVPVRTGEATGAVRAGAEVGGVTVADGAVAVVVPAAALRAATSSA